MTNKNLKVVGNINPSQQHELEQVKAAIGIVGSRYFAIKAQVGFDIKSSELKEDTQIPSFAPANDKMGFETMGDFIAALNIQWDDWAEEVKAQEIKERFHVTGTNNKAIIVQYNDVCQFLGREPYNAEDFHDNKDQMTRSVINRLEAVNDQQKIDHAIEVKDYEEKVTNLKQEISTFENSIASLNSEKQELIKQREEAKITHQTEINSIRSDFEKNIESQKVELETEKNKALASQKEELESKFETELNIKINDLNKEIESQKAEISRLNAELNNLAQSSKEELENVLNQHQEQIVLMTEAHKDEVSTNYVPRFDYQAALLKLDQETKQVMELLSKEAGVESEKEIMQSKIDELTISMTNYKTSYDNLNESILSGKISVDDLEVKRIQEILKSHESIVYKLERYKQSTIKAKGMIETKNNQLRKKDKKISNLKEKVEVESKKSKKSSVLNWLFSISAIAGCGFAGYLAYLG